MFSGTIVGYVCVVALLGAAVFVALLDRKEKGPAVHSRFLSRLAVGLFLVAFVGGVVVTLRSGVQPREATQGAGNTIGTVDGRELQQLQATVAANPNDVKARERLGHLYLQQQDFEQVFQMAHEALQINPRSVESRAHMGMVLFSMQKLDEALQQFDRALAIDPKHLETLLFKGIVQFQGLHDLQGAKATWERFIHIATPSDTGYDRVQAFLSMIQ